MSYHIAYSLSAGVSLVQRSSNRVVQGGPALRLRRRGGVLEERVWEVLVYVLEERRRAMGLSYSIRRTGVC